MISTYLLRGGFMGSLQKLDDYFYGITLLYISCIHTDFPFWLVFGNLIYFYYIVSIHENNNQVKDYRSK
jgi:hypothetical protein